MSKTTETVKTPKTEVRIRGPRLVGKAGDNLTIKQRKFVRAYLKSGNATDAVLEAGYNAKNRITASAIGSEHLARPKIQNAFARAMESAGLTDDYLVERLNKIVYAGTSQIALDKANPDQAIRAIDTIAKLGNRYPDKVQRVDKRELSVKLTGKTPDELEGMLDGMIDRANSLKQTSQLV